VLTRGEAPPGWQALSSPSDPRLADVQYLFVEGGAAAAEAFLAAGLVDRLLLYRAPVGVRRGPPGVPRSGADGVPAGWRLADRRRLGSDTLEVYHAG
jgi:diaminohydroxyphosphoribosylaminopyrimidine deaminase/5-amino-6-(5-phosphoribosylamino)uracil reductase